ncbi:MAG: pitrilysin family protein [Wenzhouxiangellaceae bacterium]|nr:pitrilysin family protein [Wenzhouxiangellaceae bacterium]
MEPGVRLVVAVLLCIAATALSAQDGPEFVTEVEGISEYRLDNGMKVLLMPDRSRPTVTVNVTYFVGSKHEGYGESGMAHLLEHMVFMGTPTRSDIKKQITERGGRANGTTWWERTNYFQTLPSGGDNLEWALEMEADRMVNSLIAAEDLESEMTVVRNEFEIGENSPFRVLMQRVMATAYEWHAYGRSTIGARADLENVPVERLQAFYRTFYQPDNAMLVVSGDFDVESTLALIDETFGAIPAPERGIDDRLWGTYTRDPVQDGPRQVTVRRVGGTPTLMVAYRVPSALHDDFAAVEALSFILGDSPSGRLHEALVEPGLASSVGAFAFRLPEPSLLIAFANLPADGDVDAAREAMLAALDGLLDTPPTEEETKRAVAALTSAMERTLNDSTRVGIGLSEWAATGDWRMLFLHRDRLEGVAAGDVEGAAGRYVRRDNRTLGVYVPDDDPQRAEIAPEPDVEELLAGYTGRESRDSGEEFVATPENIESRVQRFTLSNGAEVALLPKDTRGDRVHGIIAMRVGNLEALTGLDAVPGTVPSLLDRGTDSMTRQQIADRIDELQAGLAVGGSNVVTASLEVERENLMALIDLLADLARNPTFPDEEVAEYKRQALTGLEAQRDDPGAVAMRSINRALNPHPADHPDYTPTFDETAERYEALTPEALRDYHARFFGFGPGTSIAFVGDFEADELREKLESAFGDFEPAVPFERIDDEFVDVDPVRLVRQVDDKANAMLIGVQPLPLRDDDPDWPALELAGHMIGGGFLSSRLGDRIRNEEGLSYAVGGRFSAGAIDRKGSFFAYAMFAPENRERLEEVLQDELVRIVSDGFTAEELESAKTGYLRQLELARSEDRQLAGRLSNGLYLDRDMYFDAAHEEALRAVTVDEVNAAVAEWLDPERISRALAGDFEAAEEDAAAAEE